MKATIKKIRNYALLGTIISANATAPAEATSLQNLTPNDGLTKTPHKQGAFSNENTLASLEDSNQAHSCISVPEFDLCNQFKNDNDAKSLKGSLLRKAKNSIGLIRAGEAIKVKTSGNEIHYIIYDNFEYNASKMKVAGKKQLLYSNTYTNIWKQPEIHTKRKVPEPSVLLGLIALCFAASKYNAAKK